MTIVATLLVTKDDSESSNATSAVPPLASADNSDPASADDRSPVAIIEEDPTCKSWEPVARSLSERQKNGWDLRDPSLSSTDWSSQQRSDYEEVADAMLAAADQTVPLAQLTPHRVMRELYEQSIAYWRAYADSLDSYTPQDDSLALVASSTSGAIVWICSAINYGSAGARTLLVPKGSAPMMFAKPGDPANPSRFLTEQVGVCTDWSESIRRFDAETDQWASTVNPDVPASQWTPEMQSLAARMTVVFQENAGQLQNMGATSQNPILSDFASLAAQYQRGYVQALANYTPADNYLNSVAANLVVAIENACQAART